MPVHAHLTAEARTIAELDDIRRIAHLAEDHRIDYPHAPGRRCRRWSAC